VLNAHVSSRWKIVVAAHAAHKHKVHFAELRRSIGGKQVHEELFKALGGKEKHGAGLTLLKLSRRAGAPSRDGFVQDIWFGGALAGEREKNEIGVVADEDRRATAARGDGVDLVQHLDLAFTGYVGPTDLKDKVAELAGTEALARVVEKSVAKSGVHKVGAGCNGHLEELRIANTTGAFAHFSAALALSKHFRNRRWAINSKSDGASGFHVRKRTIKLLEEIKNEFVLVCCISQRRVD
jgi:hypothetical protein